MEDHLLRMDWFNQILKINIIGYLGLYLYHFLIPQVLKIYQLGPLPAGNMSQ